MYDTLLTILIVPLKQLEQLKKNTPDGTFQGTITLKCANKGAKLTNQYVDETRIFI